MAANEGDAERLVVLLEARIRDFEKNMAKASGTATKSFAGMRRDSKTATERMEADMNRTTSSINRALASTSTKIGSFGMAMSKGAIAAIAPLLGLSAAINATKDALEKYGAVSDSAKASGLDAEFFQGLAYQAGLAGVDVDSLAGSLATFNRNSGLADAGTGRMVTALQRLNPELLDNIRLATTQEERVRLAVDAINDAGSASEKAALAVALFGDSGTKMVDAFSGGSDQITAMASKARDLGLIVDRDLIARADELGDEFDTVTQIVDIQLKSALVDLGPTLIWLTKLAGGLASTIGYAAQQMKATGEQSTGHLEERLEWLQTSGGQVTGKGGTAAVQAAQAKNDADIAAVRVELRERAIDNLRTQLNAPALVELEPPEDAELPTLPGSGGGGGGNSAAAATVRQAEAVATLIDNLKFERSLIGQTAVEQEKMNALREAGASATDAQRQEISTLVEATYREKEAAEAAADQLQAWSDIGTDAAQSLADAFSDGKLEASELLSIVTDIAKQLLSMPAGGGGGNWLSSIVGAVAGQFGGGGNFIGGTPGAPPLKLGFQTGVGFNAKGTDNWRGGPTWVGEEGPELLNVPRGAQILSNQKSMALAAGGSDSPQAPSITFQIDARGADQGAVARLELTMAKHGRDLDSRIKKTMRDMRKYGQL